MFSRIASVATKRDDAAASAMPPPSRPTKRRKAITGTGSARAVNTASGDPTRERKRKVVGSRSRKPEWNEDGLLRGLMGDTLSTMLDHDKIEVVRHSLVYRSNVVGLGGHTHERKQSV